MSVLLYRGGWKLVAKSGVGQAVLHQEETLRRAGFTPVSSWREKSGVIHLNTVLPDSLFAALLARAMGKKVVYYGHSTREDFRNSFRGSNLLAPLFQKYISLCYGLGDAVLTPTEYSRRILEGYGIRKPVFSISNGVDTGFFTPSAEGRRVFRRRFGLAETDKVVISVGHFIERKGLPEFVELARRLPEVRFFWFGHTDLCLVPDSIRRAIESAPANCSFPGFLSREELRDAYCGADAFAFLSHEETEGIVVLEALACGTPAVLRDIPVYEGWLENGREAYLAKDEREVLRDVEGLLDGTLPSLAQAGRRRAESRSLDAVALRLRSIYARAGILDAALAREPGAGKRKTAARNRSQTVHD